MSSKELYQKLYEDKRLAYGQAEKNRCPGVRYLPLFKGWIIPSVMDFGCGTGDTVKALTAEGIDAVGIDQIELNNGMLVGDITQPQPIGADIDGRYNTAISIDVFEHIEDEPLLGLIDNMKKFKRQVITVHAKTAYERGYTENLHVNIKSIHEWTLFLAKHFRLCGRLYLSSCRALFFCGERPA